MSIAIKIISGYILIALLIVSTGFWIGMRTIQTIEKDFNRVSEETVPAVEAIEDLKFASMRMISSANEYAFISKLSTLSSRLLQIDSLNAEEGQVLHSIALYESSFARYKELVETYFSDEQHYLNTIGKSGQDVVNSSKKLIYAAKANVSDAELMEIKEGAEAAEMALIQNIINAGIHEEKELQKSKEGVISAIESAGNITLLYFVGAFLVAIIIGTIISRKISRPIVGLTDAVERLGKGDLTVKIEKTTDDEIGDLSVSFNNMAGDLHRYQKRLESQKEFLETTLNSMNDSIAVIDVNNYNIVDVNQAFLEQTNLDRNQVVGKKCHAVTHHQPEPCNSVNDPCALQATLESGQPCTVEHIHYLNNGDISIVEITTAPIKNDEGEIEKVIYVTNDITERRKAEELVHEKNEELKVQNRELEKLVKKVEVSKKEWEITMDCIGDMVLLTDDEGRIKRVNRKTVQFAGSPYEEIIGKEWDQFVHDQHLEAGHYYADGIELYHETSGKYYLFNTYPIDDTDLDFKGSVITIHDATEIKKITDELEKTNSQIENNRKKLELALNEISGLIQSVTNESDISVRLTNPNLVVCHEVKDCDKKDCVCYGKAAQRCWQVAGTYCGGDVLGKFAQKFENCSECAVYKEATSDPFYQIGEQFNNMMHIIKIKNKELEDAYSELKSTQSQMLQGEKMASIGQLAAGVAHEINNPMGFISSNLGTLSKYVNKLIEYVQAQSDAVESFKSEEVSDGLNDLKKKLKLDYIIEDIDSLIEESLDGAERVKKIVQNLKSFSRVDQKEYKPADINECLESTLNIVWNELKYNVTITKDYGELPMTRCYPQQLNQVFMNLLLNAAQAIEKEGEIIIRTWNGDGHVNISMSDTGAGIPEEKLEKIFEPFYTTKPAGKGTGLGLSISYDIIKKHKGVLSVDSEVGKGTTFNIKIPVIGGDDDE